MASRSGTIDDRDKVQHGGVAAHRALHYGAPVPALGQRVVSSRPIASSRVWRWGTPLAVALVALPSNAEERGAVDLEPVTPYFSVEGFNRTEISVVGGSYGYRWGAFVPYVGGAIGFFTIHARLGVSILPGDLEQPGLMIRLEARPQVLLNPCFEPAMLGSFGIGYRWPLEEGDPGNPGTAIYLLPSFVGGDAWIRRYCGEAKEQPLGSIVLFGGTLSGGFDW
jgi:hypothetical protein